MKSAVFRGGDGRLYLIRCPKCGGENYIPSVASGQCAWCGYKADDADINVFEAPKEYTE